jgi:transcriptional repressor NrdR
LPLFLKNDGTREPFNEDKLRSGLLRALEKRPVDTDAIEAAITRIKRQLRATGDREVPSMKIGEWVMNELRELDQVAYVRFASVYRSFQDVNAFREEIERLENTPSSELKKHQIPLLPEEDETKKK